MLIRRRPRRRPVHRHAQSLTSRHRGRPPRHLIQIELRVGGEHHGGAVKLGLALGPAIGQRHHGVIGSRVSLLGQTVGLGLLAEAEEEGEGEKDKDQDTEGHDGGNLSAVVVLLLRGGDGARGGGGGASGRRGGRGALSGGGGAGGGLRG